MSRLGSAAAAAGAFAVLGLMVAAPAAADPSPTPSPHVTCTDGPTETTVEVADRPHCPPTKKGFALEVVCRPDKHHVVLKVVNRTEHDEDYTLKLVDGDVSVSGTAPAKDAVYEKVAWNSPWDEWVLKIDHKWLKEKVGKPKDCHPPTKPPTKPPTSPPTSPPHSPTAPPSSPSVSPTEPHLPTTGAPGVPLVGVGAGLVGVGALAVLLARRRRTEG